MDATEYEVAWNIFAEGRKEILEYQRLRTQIIGFKLTFASAAIGGIIANLDKVSPLLLAIPAYAAVLFDFLIASYTFDIRRIGYYCRVYLEPVIRKEASISDRLLLWEEYIALPGSQQRFLVIGNVGITLLAVAPGAIVLFMPFRPLISSLIWVSLFALLGYDLYASLLPNRFRRMYGGNAFQMKRIDKVHGL